jgi:RimJ/RimL family protein N-acetyltransferase
MAEKKEIIKLPFIKGERIDLAPIRIENVILYAKWINNPAVRRYSRNPLPRSIDEMKKWLEPKKEEVFSEVFFEINHKEDQKPIGMAGLTKINWLYRNANLFIEIGEIEYWGKGLADEIAKMVLDYAFEELNLHKIYTSVFSPNERSMKATRKVGFIHEGILREEIYVDGIYVDEHKFGILKRDWMDKKFEKGV